MTQKFEANDRFVVKENGLRGQVICVYSISIAETEAQFHYNILWDHFADWVSYAAKDVDDLWDKAGPGYVNQDPCLRLPKGIEFIPITVKVDCMGHHTWLTYNGFRESYEYCQYCDEKRK